MTKDKKDQAVVFDFGEVLFKTSARAMYEDRFRATGRSEDELDYFLSNIFTSAARGQANYGTMASVTEELTQQFPVWEDDILAFNADRDFINQVRGTIKGMPELVMSLKNQGYKVFGLTNWAADTIVPVKQKYPFLSHMDDIVVSGEEGIKKPDINIFNRAASRYGVAPENLVFFDDKQANIEAARNAGWQAERFESIDTVRQKLGL